MELLTKDKILDSAESQFSQHGFRGASLRGITQAAGVNLAAINYHFGSKAGLIKAVLERIADPINRERLDRLTRAEEAAAPGPAGVEEIVDAFLWPALRMNADPERGPILTQIMGKVHSESAGPVAAILAEIFNEVAQRFLQAMERTLPELSRPDLAWRFLFMVGSMAFSMMDRDKVDRMSGGLAQSSDVNAAREQLVAFLAAGLRAPTVSGVTS